MMLRKEYQKKKKKSLNVWRSGNDNPVQYYYLENPNARITSRLWPMGSQRV